MRFFPPMPLVRRPAAFDSPDWLYEVKLDGFRALAVVEHQHCQLVSRNGYALDRWPSLATDVAAAVPEDTTLDGEVVCLDDQGRAQFAPLLFGRAAPCFVAFDVLRLQGRDLCALPLRERKALLADLLPVSGARVARVTPVPQHGRALCELACVA